MPRLRVVALGGRLPAWAEQACAEYAKRMPRGYEVERVAAKTVARKGNLVALDEHGKDMTTQQFTALLKTETTFVIGGPDGLDAKLKATADETLRLSDLTLPHAFARVLLAEALYRAWSLTAGHPYHRE